MIELPFKYQGLDNRTWTLVGWTGSDNLNLQVVDPYGRKWNLKVSQTTELLKALGLTRGDIPESFISLLGYISTMEKPC